MIHFWLIACPRLIHVVNAGIRPHMSRNVQVLYDQYPNIELVGIPENLQIE